MIRFIFTFLVGAFLASCGQAQPSDTPQISSGYLYKVETGISGKEVYICGQRPFNAQGQLVGASNLGLQTKQVFENLTTALKTVNMTLRNVTQVTYMIKNAATRVDSVHVKVINAQAANQFTQVPGIVEMKNVAQNVRDDVLIEIEVTAVK
jgi:2-iminobutanoate/2-iminopropanoate deaminase